MDEPNIVKMLEMLGSPAQKIKHTGGNILTCCPLGGHEDKTPSFSIAIASAGPSAWQCFACKERGNKTLSILYKIEANTGIWREDVHELIRKAEYGTVIHKVAKLRDYAGQKTLNNNRVAGRKALDESGYFVHGYEASFNEADYREIMAEVPQYILDRGITIATCARWRLGYHKLDYPPRLFIPIYARDGRMVGWSGRLIHPGDAERFPKYKHVKHFAKEKYLYGEHLVVASQKTCFITESFMDVLNLDQLGVRNCLAIMGTSISAAQVAKCKQWFERAVILPHDDEPQPNGICAGMKMAEDVKFALEQAGLKVMIGPIVPHKRQIGDEFRSPQDPGEWTAEDLKWAFDIIRKTAASEPAGPAPVDAQEEKARGKEETVDGSLATEAGEARSAGLRPEGERGLGDAPAAPPAHGSEQRPGLGDRVLPEDEPY